MAQDHYSKLDEMGKEYCNTQTTTTGGAFGEYTNFPLDNSTVGSTLEIFGIVDDGADVIDHMNKTRKGQVSLGEF